ncbi:MAG: hypothetical protein DCF15_20105 [Phormidesmis priestleyi]|uniref:WG repeat-containing protein n=1 Tax=Phormidesmis priestleyi TaxID=268141 RepID=A0A2W4YH79_9CYAN|nr:MAG: hypothetical protein DCF15_20105 [Phormidesmis priestleyi]
MGVPPQYRSVQAFSEGLAAVRIDEGWGYIDTAGAWRISPRPAGTMASFSDGIAVVEEYYKFGYINKTGEWVVKPQFDSALELRLGLAAVRVDADERGFGGSWGFIDRQGRWAIRPVYGAVYSFSDGFARVCFGGDGCGFIYR